MTASALPKSVDAMLELLTSRGYLAERSLATVTFLALRMGRPLFLEGEAGVGKTEIAKVLSAALGRKLIRLQCYEGLDVASAVYEWNSAAQMIAIRLAEAAGDTDREALASDIFAERFLIQRPLLQALEPDVAGAPVLLIDELDRADEAFEAYLLEILSDFQVTIPEFGTVKAPEPPIVIITSNRTREIHDALKRRCLYHWVDYPSAERELAIVKSRVPNISAKLSQQVVRFVQALRDQDFYKSPGVAETIDWATALSELDARSLTPQMVGDTLGALLKYQDDIARMQGDAPASNPESRDSGSDPSDHPGMTTVRSEPMAINHLNPPTGQIADNVVGFARALRAAGIPVGPGGVIDALNALQLVEIGNRADVYATLESIFVKRHEHALIFAQAFELFFRAAEEWKHMLDSVPLPDHARKPPPPASRRVQEALAQPSMQEERPQQQEQELKLSVSDREVLQKKDFAQMSAAEIAEVTRAIAKMRLPQAELETRRYQPDARGLRLDMRRTIRSSLRTGGEIIDIRKLGRIDKPAPIVALLDISGSMSEYTRLFLHFLHAIIDARKRVSVFLFGTRLTNVTRALRARDPDEALASCSQRVEDWAGGTRISASLHTFNQLWARRVLGQGAIVLLISDGLEREADTKLAFEMDRLHRSCRRLIWLNPLLRYGGFEAKAQGIKMMLPHVDEFRPVHNLSSIGGLIAALSAPPPPHHRSLIRSVA